MTGIFGGGVNPILNVLQNTDQILNVTIIATLAGLSLMALILLSLSRIAPLYKQKGVIKIARAREIEGGKILLF